MVVVVVEVLGTEVTTAVSGTKSTIRYAKPVVGVAVGVTAPTVELPVFYVSRSICTCNI